MKRRFAEFVIDRAGFVAFAILALTLFFLYPCVNTILSLAGRPLPGPTARIGADANALLPDHPFVRTQEKFTGVFGNSSVVAIVLEVRDGTVFAPEALAKLQYLTRALDGAGFDTHAEERLELVRRWNDEGELTPAEIRTELDRQFPPYPVNHYEVRSLVHPSTRILRFDKGGGINAELAVPSIPTTREEAAELRVRVRTEAPELFGSLVSEDEKAALVRGGLVAHRLNSPAVYLTVLAHLRAAAAHVEDENHRVYVTGAPVVIGWVLAQSWEVVASVGAAIVVTFFLLWGYFRRLHGVVIPAIAALTTTIWGIGFTAWAGLQLSPLMLVIPMIITARAVSHTVQMAERFFEVFEELGRRGADPLTARREAAIVSLSDLIVPGTLGVLTDVAGMLMIGLTTIQAMRDLALMGAFWVAAIVVTVELLHPILILSFAPPKEVVHYVPRWTRWWTGVVGRAATDPVGRVAIAGVSLVLFAGALYVTITRSMIGDTEPGTSLFWPDHPVNKASEILGDQFGGADVLVLYAEGDRDGSAVDAQVLRTMELLERTMKIESDATGSVSIVNVLHSLTQYYQFNDPKYRTIPNETHLYVWLTRLFTAPGTLDPLLSRDDRAATSMQFYRDHKGPTVRRAIAVAQAAIAEHPVGEVYISLDSKRASPDAGLLDAERLADFAHYMLGPTLPPRAHTLNVRVRENGGYTRPTIQTVAEAGPPPWAEEFRDAAVAQYGTDKGTTKPGHVFTWPDALEEWSPGDIDQWWESDSLGIRAAAVKTRYLLVEDLKAVDGSGIGYQPSDSWTRGAQFVLAGGNMGTLAAINEEVERSHVAGISLILFVIFVLHSVTYRSLSSGAIVVLQVATATLFSLAYMAIRGIGLNINTLPVQVVGVGIGVDYAIYIVDRIRQESATGIDVDEAIRRAVSTTGLAVTFTASTVVGGIAFWIFSSLRFQGEMAQLLAMTMLVNMIGATTVVPAFYSLLRPRVVFQPHAQADDERVLRNVSASHPSASDSG